MTVEQSNEYMKNVKWTTAGIVFSSTISLVVALVWFSSDIKQDIVKSRSESKEQITAVYSALNRKIDSNQHTNDLQFQSIWFQLNEAKPVSKKAVRTPSKTGCFIQKYINGKREFIPVDCN